MKGLKLTDAVNARLDHRGCKEVDEGWTVESVRKVLINPTHHGLVAVPTEYKILKIKIRIDYVRVILTCYSLGVSSVPWQVCHQIQLGLLQKPVGETKVD